MPINPGLRAGFAYTVTEADTAVAAGSGDVPVLATPRVLALAERATVQAVAGALGPEATTVGARVELEHLQASPVGAALRVGRCWSGWPGGGWSSRSACWTRSGWPHAAG